MKKEFVFGNIPISLISKKELIDNLVNWCKRGLKKKIFYTNIHTIFTAKRNKNFLTELKSGDVVYPDGWGPLLAFSKTSEPERVNAADFIDNLLIRLNKNGLRIYLLGDKVAVLEKIVKVFLKKYTNIKIVGFHSGFFTDSENRLIVKEINNKKPQLVLVAMSTPKQELWISDNWNNLPKSVFWSVGGLFNYIAETRKRAPLWMRKYYLEWLYRFMQEPKRLFFRYTFENLYFLFLFITSHLKLRPGRKL